VFAGRNPVVPVLGATDAVRVSRAGDTPARLLLRSDLGQPDRPRARRPRPAPGPVVLRPCPHPIYDLDPRCVEYLDHSLIGRKFTCSVRKSPTWAKSLEGGPGGPSIAEASHRESRGERVAIHDRF
jgi:hypothetical protein